MAAPFPSVPIILEPVGRLTQIGDVLAILDRMEPQVRRAFLEAVGDARGRESLAAVARMLERGDLDAALASWDSATPRIASAIEAAYTASGSSLALAATPHAGTFLSFEVVNPRAADFLRTSRAGLIRELGREQRAATVEALSSWIRAGEDPRIQARVLKQSIGLTERQSRAVGNYRRLLSEGSPEALSRKLRDRRFDASVRRAISGERPLTRAQIDVMVGRYRERYVAFRARTIARTESVSAVHGGEEEMLRQLVEQGLTTEDQIQREWRTARDERVRGSHRAMHGQKRPLGEPFVSGNGNRLMHPGDPSAPPSDTVQCRCVLAVRVPRLSGDQQQSLGPR